MNTENIFKVLALAMLMPAMLLTTACSSDDDTIVNNPENTPGKGYALPVTLNVTRQGSEATTRATFDDVSKTLSFSTGDQLFIQGTDAAAGQFAGTLEWQSEGTFSGTIYTASEYSGTAVALLRSASTVAATLLPSGYSDYGFLSVSGDGYGATLSTDAAKAFATSKAAAVEQLSLEQATAYSNGFALAPQNAIIYFTAVTGMYGNAPASSSVSLQVGETTISGSVAPVEGDNAIALANFAMAVTASESPSNYTLTVDGTSVSLGSKTLVAGKIYNQKCANINVFSLYIQENEKWLVYGTGEPSGWRLSIDEGATVTLSNVYLSEYGVIVYRGNNTIILADGTTNRVEPEKGTAISGETASGVSLTITGTGTLIAKGGKSSPAIGANNLFSCGDITIASTVTLKATAGAGYAKAITTNGGGTVTIGGTVYPGDVDSPFTYPALPANTVDLATLTVPYVAQDGIVLTGTLDGSTQFCKITIADGATVTLDGANINGTNKSNYNWAGINCAGGATIILKGENTVKGFYENWPGIYVPSGKTVTIQGDGSLTASSNGWGAGIGGGYDIDCGNIVIEGGTINAIGDTFAAGIGGGKSGSCGTISITGGTINATGGDNAAGIGGGKSGSCGTISIASTVTSVTATKGEGASNSIGAGFEGTCAGVTIETGANVTQN